MPRTTSKASKSLLHSSQGGKRSLNIKKISATEITHWVISLVLLGLTIAMLFKAIDDFH